MTVINEVKAHADKAIGAIDKAKQQKNVTKNNDEFERVKNDVYVYHALAYHYAKKKPKQPLYVLRYKYSDDIKNLDKALQLLVKSVADYQRLVVNKRNLPVCKQAQTQQRKYRCGVDATYKTWRKYLFLFRWN